MSQLLNKQIYINIASDLDSMEVFFFFNKNCDFFYDGNIKILQR